MDRLELRADQLDPEAVEVAGLRERDAHVQPRLAADRGEQHDHIPEPSDEEPRPPAAFPNRERRDGGECDSRHDRGPCRRRGEGIENRQSRRPHQLQGVHRVRDQSVREAHRERQLAGGDDRAAAALRGENDYGERRRHRK